MRARQTFAVLLAASLVHIAGAQPPAGGPPRGTRISGTIKSVTAGKLVLATAKGDVTIALTAKTRIAERKPASADDIKPGSYLGTANQNASSPDVGTATEVHLMKNGPNVNFAMNNSGLMMTNGHVTSVTPTASGEELNIDYGQGTTRHVVLNRGTQVTQMTDIGAEALKPSVPVTVTVVAAPDGTQNAGMILVGRPTAPAP